MRLMLLFVGILWWTKASGQSYSIDTTLVLEEVEIIARPNKDYQLLSTMDRVSSILENQSVFFIKNYGPGQLSTLSVRGSSAGQNAVYWQGVEISSPMLGLIDVNQLNYGTHNSVHLSSFGTSDHNISIGGQLDLKTRFDTIERNHIDLSAYLGSFGSRKVDISYSTGCDLHKSMTGFYYGRAKNDFTFINNLGESRKMTHSEHNEWSLSHSSSWTMNKNDVLEGHIWLRGQRLHLGPAIHQDTSSAVQDDENYRVTIDWKSKIKRLDYKVKLSVLHDRIHYIDPLIDVDDPANSTSYILGLQFFKTVRTYAIKTGVDINRSYAISENYDQSHRRSLYNVYMKINKDWSVKHRSSLLLNQHILDTQLWYPAFGFEHEFMFSENWSISANLARAIRIPTLNDLYWSEGGNPDLKPEQALKNEFILKFRRANSKWSMLSDLAFFNTYTQDWILWQPVTSNLWSPINVRRVWSRGLHPSIEIKWHESKDRILSINASYEWVKATYQNSLGPGDASKGKQLIYTPQHSAHIGATLFVKKWNLNTNLLYKGETYTSRDNLRSIPGYFLINGSIGYHTNLANTPIHLECGTQNATNTSYQVIASRAMPLRNYYFKLNIKLD